MVLDPDVLIDEILARKGPQTYTDGLSEDNWEEVGGGTTPTINIHFLYYGEHVFIL